MLLSYSVDWDKAVAIYLVHPHTNLYGNHRGQSTFEAIILLTFGALDSLLKGLRICGCDF